MYYTHEQLRVRRFLGPDFFLVRDVDPRLRTSWVVWEEDGRYPDLIIAELAKLPAGRVNELKSQQYRDLRQRAARKMMALAAPAPMVTMEMAAGAADMAAPKEIIKEGLSEYFIYDWRQD